MLSRPVPELAQGLSINSEDHIQVCHITVSAAFRTGCGSCALNSYPLALTGGAQAEGADSAEAIGALHQRQVALKDFKVLQPDIMAVWDDHLHVAV